MKNLEKTVDEGYKVLPNIDKERYTEIPGLEGPFQTMSGKPIYYDPKEGAYYDRDTDMYLTYDEFKKLDEVDKSAIDAAVQQALDSDIPVPKTRPTKVPRPKPRPVMIGSNPRTGATRGIDPRDNYSPEDLKRLLMQSAMEQMQTEGEAGDHDRMYKVVHVKKGMMDIKAKTSYEAAKKFAKEKGLKSTAGVDTHLYPLEEAKLDKNFFRNIASMDEPHEEIYRLLTADGPEGDVIRREYEITAGENGLHPDDDFEEILDMMVHDFEDMTFESVAKFYDEYDTPVKVEVTDDKILYNGAPIDRYSWQIAQTILTPQMYKNAKSWDDVHAYLKSAEEKGQLQQAMQATFDANPEGITVEGKNKMGPQEIMPGDRVEHEGDMYEVVAVDGFILTVDNLQTGNRTQLTMDDVTRLSGMDAMTDQDKENAEAMFKRLKKAGSGSLKHVATEGYYTMPDIDRERYTDMPGLEGPFQTRSGKPIYYDPKEGSYYDRDTDMYLTYSEFKALDDPKPETGRMKEAEFTIAPLPSTKRVSLTPKQNFSSNYSARYQSLYPSVKKEGKSPHKKGTKKYKDHMAAMHANSVDLNKMRDALKLDESADANTVIAEYTRATLDHSYKTWKQVEEQIAFIRSFVKEDVDVNAVKVMLRKMHERENLDHKMLVKENINKLNQIVNNKKSMSIKFTDGDIKVDTTTAGVFLEVYNKQKQQKQEKIVEKIQTKAGFISMLEMMYKKIG